MQQPTRRKLVGLINQAVQAQPLNKAFLTDLMSAIERHEVVNRRPSSKSYKPSSLTCLRMMYFMRTGAEQDITRQEYNGIGMADTGSKRHESIQTVLTAMESLGYDWRYIDVADYVRAKQLNQELLNITVIGQDGFETKLYDHALHTSFLCDGIIQQISTGKYYLFEFKNQISFKYSNKTAVDKEHILQVTAYCTSLDLDAAFVVYENRDNCELECPEIFRVSPENKQFLVNRIMECEGYVERIIIPPKHPDTKPCRWCKYKGVCQKAGN